MSLGRRRSSVRTASERTPLLQELPPEPIADDGAIEQQQAQIEGDWEPENAVPIADQPSTKKLVVILGSIWVGVFLGALGLYLYAVLRESFI